MAKKVIKQPVFRPFTKIVRATIFTPDSKLQRDPFSRTWTLIQVNNFEVLNFGILKKLSDLPLQQKLFEKFTG